MNAFSSLLSRLSRLVPAAAVAFAVLQGCAVNPVSGEREFVLVSEDQEIAMGAEGAKSVGQSIGLVDDQGMQSYVQRVGMRLAADSERPELPWSFSVLDDPTPNAFAFPGGYIFVTRGMMGLMRNEAELAGVLGHEIGHVTARHSVQMMTRAQVAQIGLGVGSIISPEFAEFSRLAAGGLQVLFMSYSRDAERQADDLGFRYSKEHGYDVREMTNVFASLRQAGKLAGTSPVPNWLASHPEPGDRIDRIEAMLADVDQPLRGSRVGLDDYMGQIDGMIYGTNPRKGYFEDNLFLHPDMAFRMTFPQGWRTQNLAQAVMAGSPEEDAIVQMTLAEGSPNEAADQFFGQEGLTADRVGRQTINGLPAVAGRFQAETQNGTVGGHAAFISYRDRTFQILAFTPAERMGHYDRAFRSTIGSFAKLTDRAALEKQPDRIEIVRPRQTMTLETFNQRYPSEVEFETLALINQLPGRKATIPAGTPIKRVVGSR